MYLDCLFLFTIQTVLANKCALTVDYTDYSILRSGASQPINAKVQNDYNFEFQLHSSRKDSTIDTFRVDLIQDFSYNVKGNH